MISMHDSKLKTLPTFATPLYAKNTEKIHFDEDSYINFDKRTNIYVDC